MIELELKLSLTREEFAKLLRITEVKTKANLREELEGQLNNWILETLLDQEFPDE